MQPIIETVSGIKTVLVPMDGAPSVTIQVLVKAGSIYEQKHTNGLSHFLEHMFFKGGKKFTTPKDVSIALDTLGASFNAFTSDEYAGYYVKVAPQFLTTAMEVLADMLVDSQFPKDEIETEKGVVLQEIMMYEDMPNRLVHDKWGQRYYGDNALGWSILGPAENVQSFTQDDLFAHRNSLYTKDNLVIVVTGAIENTVEVQEKIGRLFERLPEKKSCVDPVITFTKPESHEDSYKKGTQQNHVIIGADGWTIYDDERYAASVLANIVGGTMSSRLFQNIREKQGLCYYIGATHQPGHETGTFYIYAGMEKARWSGGLEAIYNEAATVLSGGITDQEYDQVRKNIQGSLLMSIETSDEMAHYVAKQLLYKGKIISVDDHLNNYLAVTKEQINSAAQRLAAEHLYAYWIE